MLVAVSVRVPAPCFSRVPGAGDRAAVGEVVRAIEDERAVIHDVAGDRDGGAAIADLQRAGGDGGAARVGARAGEREGAGAFFLEGAGAGDRAA